MSFILGYFAGIGSVAIILTVLVLIGKAKQSYDSIKRK